MVSKVMDFRGVDCPEPLIKVSRAIAKLSPGDTLMVLIDIPRCVEAIKDTIEGFDIGTIEVNKKEEYYELVVTVKVNVPIV